MRKIGQGNYTLFLTADHAATDVPQYLINNKIPAGYYDTNQILENINKHLEKKLGVKNLALNMSNEQIFFDRDTIEKSDLDFHQILNESKKVIEKVEGVFQVLLRPDLEKQEYKQEAKGMVQSGFHLKRSGDIVVLFNPSWCKIRPYGTEHGSGYSYDTHVPLLWFGNQIPKGSTTKKISITDIAPTISMLLDIKFSNACIGEPINELFNLSK